MTASPDNFLPPLPPGLDEVDLLAWLEGDPLPRNREVAVARLLSDHPALARRLEAMRRDRDALRAISGDERAPAGLLDGVQAALQPVLERQMLLGLSDGEALDDHPPVSRIIPARRTFVDVLFRERAGRRMALAAGLLLLVGGTTWFAASMYTGGSSRPNQPGDLGTLAHNDAPPIAGPEGFPLAPDESTTALALNDRPIADDPAPEALASAPEAPEVEAGDDPGAAVTTLAQADEPAPEIEEPPPMTTAEALRLAEDRRLVIRVRLGEGLVRSERIADRLRRNSSGWRYSGQAPQALAEALIRPIAPDQGALIRPGEVIAGMDLGDMPIEALMGPPAPRELIRWPEARTDVFLVQSRLDSASIDSLRTALAGVSAKVWFEEAEPGVEAPIDSLPNLAPSAVLWWGQPPTAWTWWTSIPVVVEPGR